MVVSAKETAAVDKICPLALRNGANLAEREQDLCAFHNGGSTLFIQEGYQGFTGAELKKRIVSLESGICAEGIGSNLYCLLVLGAVGAEGVLYAVAQLAEDIGRDVRGALGDEIDANALGADEADNLLNLVCKGLGSAFKEHVGLVKEEHKLGKIHLSNLRKGGVQL